MSNLNQKAIIASSSLLLVWALLAISPAHGGTIVPIDRRIYNVDSVAHFAVPTPITALLLGGDTVLSGSSAGIWVQYDRAQPWRKLIGTKGYTQWWPDCSGRDEFERLYHPTRMWYLDAIDQVVVFEGFCGCLLILPIEKEEDGPAVLWRKERGGDYLNTMTIQGNQMVFGIYSKNRECVALSRVDDPGNYRNILCIPMSLEDTLASLGVPTTTYYPALNPRDNTIWLVIWGYDYIQIIDADGQLLDSVHIGQDFVMPQPPLSRVRSGAVWRHWLSQWTPPRIFQYVPPGYFILQYRTGWDRYNNDSIPRYSTQAWNDMREPVLLEVPHDWQLAGAHDDGRLIFGRHIVKDGTRRIELNIVRIEP